MVDSLYLSEHHLYGSSRLGIKSYPDSVLLNVFEASVLTDNISSLRPWYHYGFDNLVDSHKLAPYTGNTSNMFRNKTLRASRTMGLKHYELTDHLGNVNIAILDKKTGTGDGNPGEYAYLSANISSFTDYYNELLIFRKPTLANILIFPFLWEYLPTLGETVCQNIENGYYRTS
jgi:hypothetical protein